MDLLYSVLFLTGYNHLVCLLWKRRPVWIIQLQVKNLKQGDAEGSGGGDNNSLYCS